MIRLSVPANRSKALAATLLSLTLTAPTAASSETLGDDLGLSENQLATITEAAAPDVLFYGQEAFLEYVETENLIGADPPLIIPAADFIGDGGTQNTFFPFVAGYIEGASSDCVLAPVYLPDGAEIQNFFAYLYDDSAIDIFMTLYRSANGTHGGSEVLASINTNGASTFIQIPGDTTVSNPIVDNDFYSYYVTACLSDSNHKINAVWIYYDPPVDPITVSSATVVSDFGGAEVFVEESSLTEARRQMFTLENNGPPEFVLRDNSLGLTWKFGTRNQNFEINKGGSGLTEMTIKSNGDLQIAGTLSQGSSRTLKEDFRAVDTREILEQVNELPLLDWTYKTTEITDRHFGPMAEDFHETFGLGDNPERLAPGDAAGIALAAIQGLHAEKDEELDALRAEIDELRELLEAVAR